MHGETSVFDDWQKFDDVVGRQNSTLNDRWK